MLGLSLFVFSFLLLCLSEPPSHLIYISISSFSSTHFSIFHHASSPSYPSRFSFFSISMTTYLLLWVSVGSVSTHRSLCVFICCSLCHNNVMSVYEQFLSFLCLQVFLCLPVSDPWPSLLQNRRSAQISVVLR